MLFLPPSAIFFYDVRLSSALQNRFCFLAGMLDSKRGKTGLSPVCWQ
jgi:hypothetical protein